MRYEQTQPRNPHGLTINQHVLPRASIARFANEGGLVPTYLYNEQKTILLHPKDKLFCARRIWNQASEHGFMKRIEDSFQTLADNILSRAVNQPLKPTENKIISQFYALCRLRAEARQTPTQNYQLKGVMPENTLTNDQEEILEKNGYIFALDKSIPSRHIASIRIQFLLNTLCTSDTTWAVVYSREIEFIVPDSFGEIGIVPLSPNFCLIVNQEYGEISYDNAIKINRMAINCASKYYFARDLAKSGIL